MTTPTTTIRRRRTERPSFVGLQSHDVVYWRQRGLPGTAPGGALGAKAKGQEAREHGEIAQTKIERRR